MALADLVTQAGGDITPPAPEHPAIPLLERAIARLSADQPRAAVDALADAMALLEQAMDAIGDHDDLMAEF